MHRTLVLALLIVQGLVFVKPVLAGEFDHSRWNALLEAHVMSVRGGQATQVDYQGLRRDQEQLQQYLDRTSGVTRAEFDQWRAAEQLAFLINSYNAWTVALVLTGEPDVVSIKDLGTLFQSPWKKQFIPLLGETRSLDDIEHGLIRGSGRYNDPRIHFAVNCASLGCPALRPQAYTSEQLNVQLEDATHKFLSDRTRNRLDGDALKVSSIFKWYREDFDMGWREAHRLEDFLAIYREPLGLDADATQRLLRGEISIGYLDYDWQLNGVSQPAP